MRPDSLAIIAAAAGTRPPRALHLALWLTQLLLAAAFLLVGWTHAVEPIEVAVERAAWVASLPVALVRFIGVAELAGALGLVLPAATRVAPVLTPLAAAGLAVMMALAIPFHLMRGETSAIAINLVLGALAAFVAWGRGRRARIVARARQMS
jgi:uncharacterized membrane protein